MTLLLGLMVGCQFFARLVIYVVVVEAWFCWFEIFAPGRDVIGVVVGWCAGGCRGLGGLSLHNRGEADAESEGEQEGGDNARWSGHGGSSSAVVNG